jgi:integrase
MPSYRSKNGKWFCKFYYTDWTGEKKQKKKSGFTRKKDAEAYERDFIEHHAKDPSINFAVFVDEYLKIKKEIWKPTTYNYIMLTFNSNITPYFRTKNINEITPMDIQKWYSALSKKGLKPVTVRKNGIVLSASLNFAVRMYGLTKNPVTLAESVKCTRAPVQNFLTIEEFDNLVKYGKLNPRYLMLTKLLFWTGIRISEAMALTKNDIYEDHISVDKNLVYTPQTGVIIQDTIKNGRNRDVTINKSLHEELQKYMDTLSTDVLFPVSKPSYGLALHAACKRAGVTDIRVHDLRHSHVALLIHLGFHPKTIADRIGDDVKTVLTVYSHVYESDKKEVADKLEKLIVPK